MTLCDPRPDAPAQRDISDDPRAAVQTLPLTLAQLDFWEEFRFHPDEPVSTVAHIVALEGTGTHRVDGEALARAISQVIAETDVLRLRFHAEGDALPTQSFDPARLLPLRRFDLRAEADPEQAARSLIEADMATTIDLRRDPLSSQWLLRLSEDRWQWYNRGHHIILDGYSMGLIEQRCAELYAHFAFGTPEGRPFARFDAYLAEEHDYRSGPRHQTAADYWRAELERTGPLPLIRKGDENYALEGYGYDFALSVPVGDAPDGKDGGLAALVAASGMGWADLLTALSAAYLLGHLAGPHRNATDDAPPLAVWLPFMSRMGSVSARIPALVVNILPLAVKAPADGTLGGFLSETAAGLRRLRKSGRYRIEQIAEDCGIPFGTRFFFSPLINVMPFDRPAFAQCSAERQVLSNGPNDGFNITIRAEHDGSGMELRLDADPALTPLAEFEAHCRDFPAFLAACLSADSIGLPLSSLFREGREG